ncbi:MAG TPA: ATP-binding protein [Kiritimatiellia bacterium]|nr:ATP-binding protein [Kiritimatiellia bacterium]HRZ11353.1 ATP-binding protein [Kiritimatiellia bacterium]HSA17096.1 ATP-binding protein [Kiritimatiellia bacterium]
MPDELRLTIANRLDELERAEAEISAFMDRHRVPPARRYAASLALEEMLSNIIKYGYDDAAEHAIGIRVESGARELALTLEDDGHPFDPTALAAPDTSQRIEDRSIGGLGIHLVRRMTDGMTWRREGGKNVVRIVIRRDG